MDTRRSLDFPDDDKYWMVTWINTVKLIEEDYELRVDLTAVDIQAFTADPYRANTFINQRRTIQVGVGIFPLLVIGSIWYRQALFLSPDALAGNKHSLTILIPDPRKTISTTLDKVALAAEQLHRVHPFRAFHRNLLGSSFCRVLKSNAVTVEDGRHLHFLLLPPSELLRFYHCGSASLTRQLLGGGLAHDQVFVAPATRYNADAEELFIRMRGHLQDSDALFVGRLAGDQVAYREAVELSKRLQQSLIKDRIGHLDIGFPFVGPTKLEVVGKWLKSAAPGKWAFLVYAIRSCTAQLPFKKLSFYRENDNGQTKDSLTEEDAPDQRIQESAAPSATAAVSSRDAPSPGLAKGKLPLFIPAEQRFLSAPPVERLHKEQQLVAAKGGPPRWYTQVERYTVAQTGTVSGDDIVGPLSTDVLPLQEPSTGVGFADFHLLTEQLRRLGVGCHYVDYSNHSVASEQYVDFPYPSYPTLSAPVIKRWLYLQTRVTKTAEARRKRRVIALRITYGGKSFYLVECEARQSENFSRLLIAPVTPIYQQGILLSNLLQAAAAVQGRWSKADLSLLAIRKQAIHHSAEDSPATVAQRIWGYLKRLN